MCIRDRVSTFKRQPYRKQHITAAAVCLFITLVGFMCAVVSFVTLPKCRYGDKDCYFQVKVCAYSDIKKAPPTLSTQLQGGAFFKEASKEPSSAPDVCMMVPKIRSIEGSSESGAEQLAVPILAVAFSVVSPVVALVGTLLGRWWISALETLKICLAASMLFLVIGARTVQKLTFDCRWWHNDLHDHSQKCHDGMALYAAAAVLLFVAQLGTVGTVVHYLEHQRNMMDQRPMYNDL
eukprot:TRINITY_DN16548_c0_g1_i1.p1 TRINITY_DN16548_c0_g1~~TRINITY_DN16548_c0_g1_i1.p1  ORF type:complete len:236 (+),score=56.43 TRINITY_DN16548_c0_g1_i1:194-901(+)